jgi:hypothetical protein
MRKKYPNRLQKRKCALAVSAFGRAAGEMHPQMPILLAEQAQGTEY